MVPIRTKKDNNQYMSTQISFPELQETLKHLTGIGIKVEGGKTGVLLDLPPGQPGQYDDRFKHEVIQALVFDLANAQDSIGDPRKKAAFIAMNATIDGNTIRLNLDIEPGTVAERLKESGYRHLCRFEKYSQSRGDMPPPSYNGWWIPYEAEVTRANPAHQLCKEANIALINARNEPIISGLKGATVSLMEYARDAASGASNKVIQILGRSLEGLNPRSVFNYFTNMFGITNAKLGDFDNINGVTVGFTDRRKVGNIEEQIRKSGLVANVEISMEDGKPLPGLVQFIKDDKDLRWSTVKTLGGEDLYRCTPKNDDVFHLGDIEDELKNLGIANKRKGKELFISKDQLDRYYSNHGLDPSREINVEYKLTPRDVAKQFFEHLKWGHDLRPDIRGSDRHFVDDTRYVVADISKLQDNERERLFKISKNVGIPLKVDKNDKNRVVLLGDDIKNLQKTNKDAFNLLVDAGILNPGNNVGSPERNGAVTKQTKEVTV